MFICMFPHVCASVSVSVFGLGDLCLYILVFYVCVFVYVSSLCFSDRWASSVASVYHGDGLHVAVGLKKVDSRST